MKQSHQNSETLVYDGVYFARLSGLVRFPQRKALISNPARSNTRSTTVAASSSIVFGKL